MEKEEIKLTDNPVKNIQIMAPYLTEKQQYVVLGMFLATQTQKEESKQKAG